MKTYLVNPGLIQERLDSKVYRKRDKIVSKWEAISKFNNDNVGFCSNFSSDLRVNTKTHKIEYKPNSNFDVETYIGLLKGLE
jgi:hypothetical protein